WRIMFIRLQEALDVLWEVEARDARSQTWCQYLFKEGDFASGLLAMLDCTSESAVVRQNGGAYTNLEMATIVHEETVPLSSRILDVNFCRRSVYVSISAWPSMKIGISCNAQILFVPRDENESRKTSPISEAKRCFLLGTS